LPEVSVARLAKLFIGERPFSPRTGRMDLDTPGAHVPHLGHGKAWSV